LSDLEAEVINLACLSIFKKQKELNYPTDLLPYEFLKSATAALTEAAMELYSNAYTYSHAASAHMGIQQNIYWNGMWVFLKNYYESKHGIEIDNIEVSTSMFSRAIISNSIPLKDLAKYPSDDHAIFITFIKNWNTKLAWKEQMSIAVHSDNLVNQGVDTFDKGDIMGAIQFYEKALEIMPNNDDALKNLKICYSKIGKYDKASNMNEKLRYL
jgi:tetratricopeptide (TPR) repeat protein